MVVAAVTIEEEEMEVVMVVVEEEDRPTANLTMMINTMMITKKVATAVEGEDTHLLLTTHVNFIYDTYSISHFKGDITCTYEGLR